MEKNVLSNAVHNDFTWQKEAAILNTYWYWLAVGSKPLLRHTQRRTLASCVLATQATQVPLLSRHVAKGYTETKNIASAPRNSLFIMKGQGMRKCLKNGNYSEEKITIKYKKYHMKKMYLSWFSGLVVLDWSLWGLLEEDLREHIELENIQIPFSNLVQLMGTLPSVDSSSTLSCTECILPLNTHFFGRGGVGTLQPIRLKMSWVYVINYFIHLFYVFHTA